MGLDLGTSSIKMAEIRIRNKPELVSLALIPTPHQSIFGGEVLNSESLTQILKALMGKLKTKTKNVSVGLWGTSVVVKKISIPKTEQNLIEEQVKWAAEQYVPYEMSEIKMDYKIMSSPSDSSENMDVLLVAATNKAVFSYAEFISNAGLRCKVLDVEGCALSNCLEFNHKQDLPFVFQKRSQNPKDSQGETEGSLEKTAVGILDVGSSTTNFIVIENGELVFCRDIPVGGSTYTNELQKSLNVNANEAESLKIDVSNGKDVPEEALSVIQSSHDIIIDEIKGNIDFFINTSELSSLDQFYVTGGCIKVPGLLPLMEENFKCNRLDPFNNIYYNQKRFSDQYIEQMRDFSSVVMGLSLRH